MFALETVSVKNQTLSATQPREGDTSAVGEEHGKAQVPSERGSGVLYTSPHHEKLSTQHANSIPGERLRAQPP